MKKSSDTIGNGTRDLPVCVAVPQPTAPPPVLDRNMTKIYKETLKIEMRPAVAEGRFSEMCWSLLRAFVDTV
jgi:hypothetical protein